MIFEITEEFRADKRLRPRRRPPCLAPIGWWLCCSYPVHSSSLAFPRHFSVNRVRVKGSNSSHYGIHLRDCHLKNAWKVPYWLDSLPKYSRFGFFWSIFRYTILWKELLGSKRWEISPTTFLLILRTVAYASCSAIERCEIEYDLQYTAWFTRVRSDRLIFDLNDSPSPCILVYYSALQS